MNRTKQKIPDSKNCSRTKNFTQIPNELLRNPEISAKAKTLLCLLLSNKWGWESHAVTLCLMMKEGLGAINNGLKELVEFNYLQRIPYKNKDTGKFAGSCWAYTDIPGEFNMDEVLLLLQENNLEPQLKPDTWKPDPRKPPPGFPDTRKQPANNTNINNTEEKNIKENNMLRAEAAETTEDFLKIRPEYFEMFWAMYPKRTQGKGSKGQAKTRWEALCRKPVKDRPRWRDVKVALHKQKKSIQWHDPNFIPLPTTWLNQQRWLDEAAEYAQGSITPKQAEPVTSLKEEIEKNKVRLLAWYREYQKRPDQPYGTVWDEANMAIRLKWERIPYGPTFLEMYSKWLEEQEWISDILPVYFQPGGKMVQRFRQQLEKEIGMDLFTGRTLN